MLRTPNPGFVVRYAFILFILAGYCLCQTTEKQGEKSLTAREIFYGELEHRKTDQKAKPPKPVSPGRASVSAVPATEPLTPLCLHANLQRKGPNGGVTSVNPEASFHVDDRLRLRIEVCNEGYLYVMNRNTSGNWEPSFMSSDGADHNYVVPGRWYSIPDDDHSITVEAPAGEEKLFVILSRRPIDWQSLEDTLDEHMRNPTGGSTHPKTNGSDAILVQNRITDGLVDAMRNLYGRDLVVERDTDAETNPDKSGWFAATREPGGARNLVILDIQIRHD